MPQDFYLKFTVRLTRFRMYFVLACFRMNFTVIVTRFHTNFTVRFKFLRELYNKISSFHVNFSDTGPSSYEILSELSLFSQQLHGYFRQFGYNLHNETLPIRYIFVYTSAIQPLSHGGMPKLICLYFKGRLLVKTLRGNEKLTAENLSVATCLSSL